MMAATTTRTPRMVGALRRSRADLLRCTALQAAVLAVFQLPAAALAQPAPNARPTGGVVVGGSVSIDQSAASRTLVTQSTQRGAVDWRTFDVGANHAVSFAQPASTAVTLNRVTSPNPSQIAGQITANGQIVIVNQSGVVFTPGSQVNAQSLLVSAAGINPKDFMAGSMVFDQAPRPNARIANGGTLTAGKAGLVGLVAPSVANAGVITARMGHVVLAGAAAHTVDMYGDGLLSIDITKQVTTAPLGPDGKPVAALVTNTGLIRADGGTVQLTAAAADGLVQTLVDAGGTIRANTSKRGPGLISISGTGGSVIVEGALLAEGRGPGRGGGQVAVNATDGVIVATGARVSGAGRAGGGTIALGTTLARAAGGPSVTGAPTARRADVQAGASIDADATGSGAGGRVTVLSSDATTMLGQITAKGGRAGGDGGFVEISGGQIGLGGSVDVSAPHGATGTILLDPRDLTVANSGGTIITPGGGFLSIAYSDLGAAGTLTDYVVTPASLAALNGTVHLQAARNLLVASSFAATAGATLEAGGNLVVQSGATISSPSGISLSAGVNFGGTIAIAGYNPAASLSVQGGLQITQSSGNITLSAPTGGVALGGNLATTGLDITTTGPLTQSAGSVSATFANLSAASISLPQPNALVVLQSANANSGDVTVANGPATPLTVTRVAVPSGQTISLSANVINLGSASLVAPLGTVVLSPASATYGEEIINSGSANLVSTLSLNYPQLITATTAGTLQLGSAAAPAGPVKLGNSGDFIDLRGLDAVVRGAPVVSLGLFSRGAVTQGGSLAVGRIYGQVGTLTLTAPVFNTGTGGLLGNLIGSLGSLSAASDMTVVNAQGLTITGPAVAGGTLSVDAAGSLALAGNLGGATVSLVTNAAGGLNDITQSGGSITAGLFSAATGGGAITLGGANLITALSGNFNALGSPATLNNAQPLTVTANLGAATTLTVTGGLTLVGATTGGTNGAGGVPGSSLSITATGAVNELGSGVLSVGTLSVAGSSVDLGTPGSTLNANQIATLAVGTASAGGFSMTDAGLLLVAGTVAVAPASAISISADGFTIFNGNGTVGLAGALVAPGGIVALSPYTPGRQIDVFGTGGPSPGDWGFNVSQVPLITAATLQLGSGVTGSIRVGNPADTLAFPNVTTLKLVSTGTVTQNGQLTVNTLTGNATAAVLTGSNTIAVLGGFTTVNGLSFADTSAFTVSGPLVDQASMVLSSPAGMTLNSNITANSLQLGTAGTGPVVQTGGSIVASALGGFASSISLLAPTNAVGSLGSLVATTNFALADSTGLSITGPVNAGPMTLQVAGPVTEAAGGSITASSLQGSASSSSFGQTGNFVSTLGSFATSTGFSLNDGTALTVTGPVTDNTAIALRSLGTLTLAGNIAAPSVSLTANSISSGNTVFASGDIVQTAGTVRGSAQVGLFADGSFRQLGGALTGGTLTGLVGGAVSAAGSANLVATLGSFTSGGGFALVNGQPLTITGPVVDGASIAIDNAGAITLAGLVNAPSISLVSSGAIAQTGGSLVGSTLSGSAADVSLGAPGNAVDTLGPFASAGRFLLADVSPLTITGPVTAASGALTLIDNAPTLGAGGSLSAGATGVVTLQPLTPGTAFTLGSGGIGGAPAVTAGTLVVGGASAGPVSITGALNLASVGTLDVLSAGAITETPGAGVTVGALTASGASVSFGGTNAIATLGPVTAPGGITLVDGSALLVTGPVNAAAGVTLNVNGPLTLAGPVATAGVADLVASGAIAGSGGLAAATLTGSAAAATLTGTNTIASLGAFSTAGAFALADTAALSVSGALSAASVTLAASAPVSEAAGGSVTTGVLQGSAPSASFSQPGNAVATLGSFTTAAGFSLIDGTGLIVTGPVTDGTSVTLRSLGTLTLAGNVTAPTISLTANNVASGNTVFTRGDIVQTGGTVAGATQIGLFPDGSFIQSGGALIGQTLTGLAGGPVNASGTANLIGTLGSFSSAGGFSLVDGQALTVTGPVTDSASVALTTAGVMTLAGVVSAPAVSLVASGPIEQSGGSLVASALSGSGASVSLGQPANIVSSVGSFASTGPFLLADAFPLTITGAVTATGGPLTILNDAPTIGAGGSLSAGAGGTVTLQPLTAGSGFTLGGVGAVTAGTLVVGGTAAGPVGITGLLNLGGVGTLDVLSAGAITEAPGAGVTVGALAASGSSVSFGGTNSIATLGSVTAPGGLTLADTRALLVSGPVNGAFGITLNVGGSLTLAGALATTGTASFTAAGAISQAGGSLAAATLTDTAASTSLLLAGNTIAVLGAISNSGSFALADQSGLTIAGALSAASTWITTNGPLVINAPVNGGAMTLDATGAISEGTSGRLAASLLQGSAASADFSQGGNAVAALGTFVTAAGLTLAAGTALTVTGPVVDGTRISIASTGTLTLAGDVKAPSVSLSAGSVSSGGTLLARGDIVQTAGTVNGSDQIGLGATGLFDQTGGALVGGLLTGRAGLSVAAAGSANQISTLGTFNSGGGFALVNGGSLTVTGPLVDTQSAVLTTSNGGLTLAGVVNAPAIALNAAGPITQTGGSLVASSLGGSGAGVSLGQPGNMVSRLASFASSGDFLFADAAPLGVAGAISAGTGHVLTIIGNAPNTTSPAASLSAIGGTVVIEPLTPGTPLVLAGSGLTNTTQVHADMLVLGNATAGGIVIGSGINLGGVATLDLLSAGPVSEVGSGAIAVGTLTGSVGAGFGLTGANQIATLGNITTQAGAVSISDTVPVTLAGSILAPGQPITIAADSIIFGAGGSLRASTLSLTPYLNGDPLVVGGGGGIAGPVVAAASTVEIGGLAGVSPLSGALQIAGDLNFGSAVVMLASNGPITETGGLAAAALTGAAPSVALTGVNAFGTLSVFTSTGGFALANSVAMTVTGPLADQTSITLTNGGPLTLAGNISASALTLAAMGSVAQTGGSVSAGTLSVSGAGVRLGQLGNVIGTLAASSSGDLLVADSVPLAIASTVSVAAGGTLSLADNAFTFAPGGVLSAPGGVVVLQPLTPGDPITLGGPAAFAANAVVNAAQLTIGAVDAGPISITGAVNFAGVPTLDLLSGSSITETGGGAVSASALSASGALVSLTGANAIGSLGPSGAAGNFALNNGQDLTLAGPLKAAAVTLAAQGGLTLAGDLSGGPVDLAAATSITHTGGTLTAGTLTGRSGTGAQFGPDAPAAAADVQTLGAFSVGNGSLLLVNNIPLTVAGPLSASTIALSAPGSITLRGLAPLAASGTLTLQVGQGGSIQLGTLAAPGFDLTLNTGTGGTASGAITVNSLSVLGSGGSASLTGTVRGIGGTAAAPISSISPVFDFAYQINGCAIMAVTCGGGGVPPGVFTPASTIFNPATFLRPDLITLDLLTLTVAPDPADPDELLPNISRRDN